MKIMILTEKLNMVAEKFMMPPDVNIKPSEKFRMLPNIDIMVPIYITQVLIIAMLLFAACKYDKLKHPATWLAVAVNLFIFLLEPLGKSEIIGNFIWSFHYLAVCWALSLCLILKAGAVNFLAVFP